MSKNWQNEPRPAPQRLLPMDDSKSKRLGCAGAFLIAVALDLVLAVIVIYFIWGRR